MCRNAHELQILMPKFGGQANRSLRTWNENLLANSQFQNLKFDLTVSQTLTWIWEFMHISVHLLSNCARYVCTCTCTCARAGQGAHGQAHLHLHLHAHTCACTCIHACTCTHVHARTQLRWACMCVCACTRTHVHVHTCTHMGAHLCTHTLSFAECAYTCAHMCVHAWVHVHMHVRMHVHTLSFAQRARVCVHAREHIRVHTWMPIIVLWPFLHAKSAMHDCWPHVHTLTYAHTCVCVHAHTLSFAQHACMCTHACVSLSIIVLWGFLHRILHIGQQVGHMQTRCNTPTTRLLTLKCNWAKQQVLFGQRLASSSTSLARRKAGMLEATPPHAASCMWCLRMHSLHGNSEWTPLSLTVSVANKFATLTGIESGLHSLLPCSDLQQGSDMQVVWSQLMDNLSHSWVLIGASTYIAL